MPSVGSDMGKESEYTLEDGPLKGRKLRLVFGDYAKEMDRVTRYCKKAAENASNQTQKDMYLAYAKSFEEGSSEVFKNSQRFWIRYVEVGTHLDRNETFSCTAQDKVSALSNEQNLAGFVKVTVLFKGKCFPWICATSWR